MASREFQTATTMKTSNECVFRPTKRLRTRKTRYSATLSFGSKPITKNAYDLSAVLKRRDKLRFFELVQIF